MALYPPSQLVSTDELTRSELLAPDLEKSISADVLVRFTVDASKSIDVKWHGRTSDVRNHLQGFVDGKTSQVNMLVNVVKWQHRLLDYNSHYNAFLLDQVSEEEFEKVASEFMYEPAEISADAIAPLISQIYGLTGIYYTPSELADLFQCKAETVMQALEGFEEKSSGIIEMLPSHSE